MSSAFTLRIAAFEDASLLATFGARAFRDAFGEDNAPKDMEAYLAAAFSVEQMEAELKDPASTFLLAYDGGAVVGYAKIKEGEAPACVTGPSPVELVRIYVAQSAIGRGYGGRLMSACLEEAKKRGGATLWLGVWQQNERAIRFYERWTFRKVGTQIFKLGEDEQRDWVMACALG